MNRRRLQLTTGLLAAIPIATGAITMAGISDPLYAGMGLPANALLDSNLRFFGGVWLAAGLAMAWVIPRIERETALFRAVWLMVFAGGIGRLLSMAWLGPPPWPFMGFTLLEVLGAPAFIVWQTRLAREAAGQAVCRSTNAAAAQGSGRRA